MPPRKKIAKKTPPARRPSTRRSAAAAAAAPEDNVTVVPEDAVNDAVAGETSQVLETNEPEKKGDSFNEAPVGTNEETAKSADGFVTVNDEREADEIPVPVDQKSEAVVNTEEDAVSAQIPDCEGKESEKQMDDIPLGTVNQESEVAATVSQEKVENVVLSETPSAAHEGEENEKHMDTPSMETPSSAVIVSCGDQTPVLSQHKEEDIVLAETPVVLCERKGKEDKGTPFVETPVSVDQKSEPSVVETPETQTPAPPQDVVMEDPLESARVTEKGVGGKPEGTKKTVRIVKKVTKRVVVKKKPKVVKEEEASEDIAASSGGTVINDVKECKPTSTSENMKMEGLVGVSMDKECELAISLDTNVMEPGSVEQPKECKPTSSSDALMLDGGSNIVDVRECNPTTTLSGDASNAVVEENIDGSDGTLRQEDETAKSECKNAFCAASGEEAPTEPSQAATEPSLVTNVEILSTDEGDVDKMSIKENDKVENAPIDDHDKEDATMSERQQRRKTEIFIGGLDRDAKEEDIRKVFGKIGEIVEIRLLMDEKVGKNKGYAFLRYRTEALAKQAVLEFAKVEVCGKLCGTAAIESNDTILLDNIDKNWKKDDLMKLLVEIGIEKIDTVTVVSDPNNADINRGFGFLDLETNKDAQTAFKKLQKKDAFGKDQNIKVSWSNPSKEPNEDNLSKIKSIFVQPVPPSWGEENVSECFKKFGEIERVVLARNIPSSQRKDYAFVNYTTHEAALSCIELFEKEEISESGTKVNMRVSLAKPTQKNKGVSRFSNKDTTRERFKTNHRDSREHTSSKGKSLKVGHTFIDQSTWRQGHIPYNIGPSIQNYPLVLHGGKRPYSSMGSPAFHPDSRGYPRARMDVPYPIARPSAMPSNIAAPPYYLPPNVGYRTGSYNGAAGSSSNYQARYGNPYGGNGYSRY